VKSKMVSLRLSREEFDRYRSASVALGMKNLSEFARMAMNKLVSPPVSPDLAVHSRIDSLRKRLEEISLELHSLSGHIPETEPKHPAAADGDVVRPENLSVDRDLSSGH
jgi:hypothetical protein